MHLASNILSIKKYMKKKKINNWGSKFIYSQSYQFFIMKFDS
jgi:hypothetical protein